MANEITLKAMQDASLDAKSLEEVVNGNEAKQVTTRLGESYPSVKKAISQMFENGGLPATPFATKALMTASALVDGDYAQVTDDTVNNGLYIKTAGAWVLSAYDPLGKMKAFVEGNPAFKAGIITDNSNFDSYIKTGHYVRWADGYTNIANAPYYSNTVVVYGILEVKNVVSYGSRVIFQTYYPDEGRPVVTRRTNMDGVFGKWVEVLSKENQFKGTTIEAGQDILVLEEGNYILSDFAKDLGLINVPEMPYRYGRLTVRNLIANRKEVIITPYGRDMKTYYNRSNESGWVGWKTLESSESLKAFLVNNYIDNSKLSGFLNSVVSTDKYGKDFTAAELNGNSTYNGGYYVGYNSTTGHTKDIAFNKIFARVSNSGAGEIEYRVYIGDATAITGVGVHVYPSNSDKYSFSGICTKFPSSDLGTAGEVVLDNLVLIPANTPFVIVFKSVSNDTFRIGFAPAPIATIGEIGFSLTTDNVPWGETTISTASPSLGYYQSGFRLEIEGIADSGSISDNRYTPNVVLPPRIFALAGLQSHIYPEHLTPESHEIYEHTVSCARGRQMVRGWLYDVPISEPSGDISLKWSLVDKQTGNTVASKNTLITIANQATAGNKNVLVIGDSYVNNGTITQRLLDLSATDPLKVSLLGTRGSGVNKHEGRGGWAVDSYATQGRAYVTFTVSGVTTAPAINAAAYGYTGGTLYVQETNIVGGAGTITGEAIGAIPSGSGILTKANTSAGDTTINFSSVASESANPFWLEGKIDVAKYLTNNGFALPDAVIIHLGVNDSFGAMSDVDAVSRATTAFAKLDNLIASIKVANPNAKIAIAAPNTYANQDAYGLDYGSVYTAWRTNRNIVLWNSEMYKHYSGKESQGIYPLATGINVDTQNNMPTTTKALDSHNTTVITVQSNSVHPSVNGYKQIGDTIFSFMKAVL